MARVYLCGPITGTQETECNSWRDQASAALAPFVEVIDPTRFGSMVDVFAELDDKEKRKEKYLKLGQDIIERDRRDVESCDLILANFLDCGEKSIGSIGEIFWANAFSKTVFVVRDRSGSPYDHLMLNSIAHSIFYNLEEAIQCVKELFCDNLQN